MTRLTRVCRAVGVGIAVTTATLAMTQVASAAPAPPTLPTNATNIAVDTKTNKVFLVGHATGVQIYNCNGTAWVFDAPKATLVADNDKNIVEHGRGPTWTATDGSSVEAKKVAEATVPAKDGRPAIPWLKLQATKTTVGPDGDRLTSTTFIQRVNTVGGVAPTDVCDGSKAATVKEVPYTADYYFWKATAGG